MPERKGKKMGSKKGARLGHAFRGTSERDDSGEATLEEAFDAAATAAVLTAIMEDGELTETIREAAAAALEALDAGDPNANDQARDVSAAAVEARGGDESAYVFRFEVQIDIETRPHNQWVRTFGVTATPSR